MVRINRHVVLLILLALPAIACNRRAKVDDQRPMAVANVQPTSGAGGTAPRPVVLASTEQSCDRIVSDDTQVFWTTRSVEERFAPASTLHTGHVMSCPVTGCGAGPTLVAEGQSHIDALALGVNNVYWTQRGFHGEASDILKCPRNGCITPQTLHAHRYQGRPHGGGPSALAVDEGGVFWIDYEQRAIEKCPPDGCAAASEVLAQMSARPRELTLAQGVVFWTDEDGNVMRCAERGCDSRPATVGSAPGLPAEIVAAGWWVVWINHRMSEDAGHASEILGCPASGCVGSPQLLVTTAGALATLTSHGGQIYWTERGGAEGDVIRACSAEHCVPSTVLTGVQAEHLVATRAGLFWTESLAHQIQTLPLPDRAR